MGLLLFAIVRANAYDDFDGFFDRNLEFIRKTGIAEPQAIGVGRVVAEIGARDGRDVGFQTMVQMLPRLQKISAATRIDPARLLFRVVGDLLAFCEDPGLLRDIAGLLDKATQERHQMPTGFMRLVASSLEAKDPETVLAHMDPDIATGLRKLRGWPEPELKPRKAKSGRRSAR